MPKDYSKVVDQVQKRMAAEAAKKERWFRLQIGENYFRLISDEDGIYYLDQPTHFSVGPQQKTCACVTVVGRECLICRRVNKMRDTGEERYVKSAERQKAQDRVWFHVCPSHAMGYPQVWSCSSYMANQIHKLWHQAYTVDGIDITDPDNGQDIRVVATKRGSGSGKFNVKYGEPSLCEPSQIQAIDEWWKFTRDLPSMQKDFLYSDEDLRAIIRGEEPSRYRREESF